MSHFPLISIGLCTFNGESFLSAQLESLINQTYRPIEIRIRDDQSTDGTLSIINHFQCENSFIHLIQNPKRLGFQKNFETVFQDCRGDFIAACDQDDIWMPDKLQKLYDQIGTQELIYHNSELINETGESLGFFMSDKFRLSHWNQQTPFLFFNCVSGHAILFRKSLLHKALPFPVAGFYDHWLAWVALDSGTIGYCDEALVKYRQHQSNQTDLIGKKKKVSGWERAESRVTRENLWLETCSDFMAKRNPDHPIIQFQQLAKKREETYFNVRFGLEIWKNRDQLLQIPPLSVFGKLAFALRYSIGLKTKILFYAS